MKSRNELDFFFKGYDNGNCGFVKLSFQLCGVAGVCEAR